MNWKLRCSITTGVSFMIILGSGFERNPKVNDIIDTSSDKNRILVFFIYLKIREYTSNQ